MSHPKSLCLTLLAIFLGISCSQTALAARWATVLADKAVIYSDIQMTSKIGYIKKGKKVRVGEKARNKGRLLPIIINKRVAYIKISDLQTSTRLEFLKSASQRLKEQTKNDREDNRIAVYGLSVLSTVVFPESATAEKQITMLFLGAGIKGYKSDRASRDGFRAGIEYQVGTSGDHKITHWNLSGDYFYKFMKTEFSDIYLFGGGLFIPFAEYQLGDLFTLNGYGVGAQAGAELLFKYSDFALHLEGAYQYIMLKGFTIGGDNPDYPSKIEPSIHGVRLAASLSWRI